VQPVHYFHFNPNPVVQFSSREKSCDLDGRQGVELGTLSFMRFAMKLPRGSRMA